MQFKVVKLITIVFIVVPYILVSVKFISNIVRVIKSRRMRWAGHMTRMGEERGVYRVLVGKPEEGDHWGDLGVDG